MFRKMRFILTLITLISILLVSCAYEQPAKQDNGKITEFNKLDEGEAEITDTPEDTTEQSISGLYAAERTGVNLAVFFVVKVLFLQGGDFCHFHRVPGQKAQRPGIDV